MVLLQPRLNLRVSQRQILTPGLVQMVSVLALNKLELRDMINAEMVENPVLEELDETVPLIDQVGPPEERERASAEEAPAAPEKADPFEEIDFGSFFKDYLDPGFRSQGEMEEIERPSFENFLSKPSTLTDHLMWQLGSIPTRPEVREAAELVIGNLNEDGYLIASDEELLGIVPAASPEIDAAKSESVVKEAAALGLDSTADLQDSVEPHEQDTNHTQSEPTGASESWGSSWPSPEIAAAAVAPAAASIPEISSGVSAEPPVVKTNGHVFTPSFNREDLHEAIEIVRQLDPPGVACRDLRECLLYQLRYHQAQLEKNGNGNGTAQVLADAVAMVDQHLRGLQNKQHKEIS